MGLIDDQQRAVLGGEFSYAVEITRFGQDDADIGKGGLHQDRGNLLVGERGLECREIVELDHAGGLCRIDRRPDVAAPRFNLTS